MRTQLHNWRVLVDCIIDKVWEFIDEFDMWPEDTTLWVEGESAAVNLGEGDQKFPGEGRPAILFFHTDEDGDKTCKLAHGALNLRYELNKGNKCTISYDSVMQRDSSPREGNQIACTKAQIHESCRDA